MSRAERAAFGLGLALILGACGEKVAGAGPERCHALRRDFDRAFADAVTAGGDKRSEAQARYVTEAQDKLLAMQNQDCCKEKDLCPALNVR